MKKLAILMTAFLMVTTLFAPAVSAEEELSFNEKKELLVEVARDYDIPPEILIAMAYKESAFQQYGADGEAFESTNGDGGFGIMQITNPDYVTEEIKTNTRANIEAGAEVLNEKWELVEDGTLPSIKTTDSELNDRDIIEHWYFAVMAYNGFVEYNVPKGEADAEDRGYQEHVFKLMENFGELNLADTTFIDDLEYTVINDDGVISFEEDTVTFNEPGTYTGMDVKTGDQIYLINNSNVDFGYLYEDDSLIEREKVPYYTTFEVVDDQVLFKETNQSSNHYGYYKVKRGNTVGYLSSSNLNLAERDTTAFETFDNVDMENVNPDKTFTINFQERVNLNEDTVDSEHVYLVSEDGQGVFATVELLENGHSIEVNPTYDLESGQTYTLYTKGVESTQGVMMGTPIRYTFTVQ
ncbi:Ig-like domain-containing protein [Halobacillus litoralis]|uniref:Ig-like domain-containing protein n=1 Tax=Halobacillus litoralis TaxID=45668 RepID=UPI001CD4D6B4|nr:Ig-like domain-containing protein [Halobacillus litoralis]MCA0972374.1 Ig-like domain-containing protein [Halobacillus litoralis]